MALLQLNIYVKSNTISSDSKVLRAVTKFTFFLLIGSTVNLPGYIIPVISGSLDIKEDISLVITIQYIVYTFYYYIFFVSHSNNNLIVPQTN